MAVLSKVFKISKLQIGAVCDINSVPKIFRKNITWEALYDEGSSLAYYVYDRFEKNPEDFASNRFLNIGPYANQLHLYKDNIAELGKQLQFQARPCYSDVALISCFRTTSFYLQRLP